MIHGGRFEIERLVTTGPTNDRPNASILGGTHG
jgi:hypothetical protein